MGKGESDIISTSKEMVRNISKVRNRQKLSVATLLFSAVAQQLRIERKCYEQKI